MTLFHSLLGSGQTVAWGPQAGTKRSVSAGRSEIPKFFTLVWGTFWDPHFWHSRGFFDEYPRGSCAPVER